MRFINRVMLLTAFFTIGVEANAEVMQRTVNNGNLVMQDVPEIPEAVVFDLARYQNVRSAGFLDWSADGKSVYIRTRFGDVPQIHIVGSPGGRRNQITFFDEPIGSVSRQPGNQQLIFTMDAGGSEFSQIFLFDPISGESSMLTDGESRNVAIEWSKGGEQFAYQSTRRNGKSNDVWMMDADNPESARIVFESPDGTWWGPGGFDTQGKQLLIQNYVSIVNSKVHLLNLATGESTLLAGGGENTSVNLSVGFDSSGEGFFFITDRGGEFNQLAWATMNNPEEVKILTSGINWDVEGVVFSDNMSRGAFVVNANGVNEVYLMDTSSFAYRKVDNLPIGLVGNMDFSPDGSKLALTLNTPATPSDTFVLSLGKSPLDAGKLTRWTYSEVGGLNTSDFIMPELIHYETFDGLQIPAFVYKPKGKGPFPVVVSIHGGPEGQALPGFSSTYQMWLAKLGAAVVVPNVRGSAGYGKSYLQLDNGYKREDSVKDIGSLLDWIATDDDLDENRVAVFGGSYGGYMVLASAVFYSDRLRAAVDVVGISNFVTFLENTQDYRRDLRRKEYGDERIPLMRKHLESISPLNNVQRINIPTLVVQGQNDPRVPVTESLQLVKALRDQGQQVWFMNGLNEGHGFRKKENRDVYQQVTMMFLKKHLLEAAR